MYLLPEGGEEMDVNVQINKAFFPYLTSQREGKFRIFYGGAGSGKSFFIMTDLVLEAVKSKRKVLILRQTNASNRESTFAQACDTIRRLNIGHLVSIHQTTMNITFKHNGSQFIFRGCDEESKLLSIQGITDCFIEEITEISREIFDQVVLRLRPPKGIQEHIYCAFNPVSSSHWIKEIIDDDFYTQENGFAMHSTYRDNLVFLPDSYVQALEEMRRTNPAKARVYADGCWGLMGKLVYNNWQVEDFSVEEVLKQYPKAVHRCGLDFGFMADETAFVSLLIDEQSKQIWVCDELYQKHLLNDAIAKWITDNGYSKSYIIADSAEQKSIAELKRLGIYRIKPAKKGRGSVNAGIQFIEQFQIHVLPKCEGFVSEISQYSYKKDKSTGLYTNEAIDKYNHLMDAMRYALEEFMVGNGKIKTFNKGILGI